MAWTAPRTWTAGELVTKAIMDTHIRDNQLAMGPHLIVRKTADQSATSDTTLNDDTALQLTVAANEVWFVQFHIRFTADTAGDIAVSFAFPASGVFDAVCLNPANNALSYADASFSLTSSDTGTLQFGGTGTGNVRTLPIHGVYVGAGTGGTLILRWCQGSSSGTATTVKANSTLWAVKLA